MIGPARKILVLNGPNLNMLGVREPEIYGYATLRQIERQCRRDARGAGFRLTCRQSNHEGALVTWIQKARGRYGGIIINAGAYTHTSIALYDALKIAGLPVVEVHISDPKTREPFRHQSYIEALAAKTIAGRGAAGYTEAIHFLANFIHNHT